MDSVKWKERRKKVYGRKTVPARSFRVEYLSAFHYYILDFVEMC